jgi:hypothetical protein
LRPGEKSFRGRQLLECKGKAKSIEITLAEAEAGYKLLRYGLPKTDREKVAYGKQRFDLC